jgi:hypothetical protein
VENIPSLKFTSSFYKKVKDHAYVSLKDTVAHFLAFTDARCIEPIDILSDHPTTVSHISQSLAAQSALRRGIETCGDTNLVVLVCFEWSDDFDPASSTKSNRNSCWIKTVTLLPCYDPGSKIGEKSTFPIGIGRKQGDHEVVEQLFAKELQSLRCGNCSFFNKKARSFVKVYLELITSLQDQPECWGSNYLMLGSGKNSTQ